MNPADWDSAQGYKHSPPEVLTSMGLEAALTVERPENCPVASVSAACGATVDSVTWSGAAGDTVVEEFEVDTDVDPGVEAVAAEEATAVFGDDRRQVYRFERDADRGCVCACIEAFGCPVTDVRAEAGGLRVVFRPTDLETLQGIIEALRERSGGVTLGHLLRSVDPAEGDTVVVDRDRLTARQREVLETAHEMGYFEHPKGANAQEVAAALDITSATFRAHVAAAQSKLLDEILEC